MNVRHNGKVIERRRGRGCPLQRTTTPWVTGQVTILLAVANRDVNLNQLAQDTQCNQRGTAGGNDQHRMELWVNLLAETTGHTHEAQHVQRHKCHEEADDQNQNARLRVSFSVKPNAFGHQ